jgi:glyoxylase-like metal-dependent hydrolase (beta-lactamase superfamily II)
MKRLHRPDLYGWSQFNAERNIDFNSVLWVRSDGNVAIDPLPLSVHDTAHLRELGGVAWIVVSNSDHVRAAPELAALTGARIAAPRAEAATIGIKADRWLGEGDQIVPGLVAYELEGSKTAGELAFLLEESTLITGDLVRAHEAGSLCLLPDAKLRDRGQAIVSVARIAALGHIDAVLTGDGWPVFRHGRTALREMLERLH